MTIESELKFLLKREGYERLRQWAEGQGVALDAAAQVNHYFDTPTLGLSKAHMMFRLRERGGLWTAAFKLRVEREMPGQHSVEIEAPVEAGLALRLCQGVSSPLSVDLGPVARLEIEAEALGVDLAALAPIGAMTTHRIKASSPSGAFVLELDRSSYGGVEDFELECEAADTAAAEGEVLALLGSLGVAFEAGPPPKFARFIEALGR